MFCMHCGAPLLEGAKFCTNCGKQIATQEKEPAPPVEEKLCAFCDTVIPDGSAVCPKCGKRVASPSPAVQTPVAEKPNPERDASGKSILKSSIMSIAFLSISGTVSSMFLATDYPELLILAALIGLGLSIVALVMAVRARRKAHFHRVQFGELKGVAKVGQIMSIPARIISIVDVAACGVALIAAMSLLYI